MMERYITGFHVIEEYLKRGGSKGILYVVRRAEKAAAGDNKESRNKKKNPPAKSREARSSRIERLEELALAAGCRVVKSDTQELTRMYGDDSHRGALFAPVGKPAPKSVDDFISRLHPNEPAVVLLLDGITDPHNVGAIIRSAHLFGVNVVVYPSRRSSGMNQTVLKASAGAAAHVSTVMVANIPREIKRLKQAGFWVYGAHMEGEALEKTNFPNRTAIVLGGEGKGLGRLVKEECDSLVSIPTKGRIDSLNVSVAAGIILYSLSIQTGR